MARGGTWSPATHHHWPDAFKAAARALLLAGNGQGQGAAASKVSQPSSLATRLPALPAEVLLRIIQLAAAPMSDWMLDE